jgi:hypothetical protein
MCPYEISHNNPYQKRYVRTFFWLRQNCTPSYQKHYVFVTVCVGHLNKLRLLPPHRQDISALGASKESCLPDLHRIASQSVAFILPQKGTKQMKWRGRMCQRTHRLPLSLPLSRYVHTHTHTFAVNPFIIDNNRQFWCKYSRRLVKAQWCA